MTEKNLLSLRRRFVKDFNLPINIVDDPYFGYYMRAYDFFPREDYANILHEITEKYEGNIDAWLQHYAEIRDNMITTILNSDAYKAFNEMPMDNFKTPQKVEYLNTVRDLNIYNNTYTGCTFVSIDLKKANFQALKYVNPDIVLGCDTYEDLIDKFGGDEYFKKSKYTRQVVFGKLNPQRTIKVEKFLIHSIFADERNKSFGILLDNMELLSVKSDEIIFKVIPENLLVTKELLEAVREEIKENNGLDVRVEAFNLERIVCTNHNGTVVDGYKRCFFLEGERYDLKNVSSIFFPQIYAFCNGKQLCENDLVFRAEDQVATFLYPLNFERIEK